MTFEVGDAARGLGVVLLLVLVAPLFGWAASAVGYAEPLERAANVAGAADAAHVVVPSPLPGYSVPGLGPHIGTILAGLVGVGLVLALGVAIGRLVT